MTMSAMLRSMSIMLLIAIITAACSTAGNGPAESVPPSASPSSAAPSATSSPSPSEPLPTTVSPSPEPPAEPQQALSAEETAQSIIAALKEKDEETLVSFIHPVKGVLFSPYAHIDSANVLTFQAEDLPTLNDQTVYQWGSYDGSGEPIGLTYGEYYDKFIYDRDFANAESVNVNAFVGKGNTLVNITDVFPESTTVEYHFSGFDPQYEGMDWESLILVLEQEGAAWYVSAIVHSSWTI